MTFGVPIIDESVECVVFDGDVLCCGAFSVWWVWLREINALLANALGLPRPIS